MPNQKKNARTYIPENISEDSDTAVPNTVKATQNWIKKLDEFRLYYNYVTPIETIEDPSLIEQQICKFIAQMTKIDRGKYKAKTVKQAIDRINRYISKNGAIRSLNLYDKYQFPDLYNILNELGEKEKSVTLTVQQVREIFNDEFLDSKMLQARTINEKLKSDTSGPTSNLTKYISKHPSDASNNFYLQPNQNWHETDIWYLKTHCGLNRVGNFMKDIGQKVKVKLSDKPVSNINPINQESSVVLTEITGSHINFNTNTIAMQDINMVQGIQD
ncbi:41510_t:CDS:2, partial [Gigaspora margarita]